jgi:hypothetical protein
MPHLPLKTFATLLAASLTAGLLHAAPIASESLSYNALSDGATLGAASADWTDDGALGGHELLDSNSGAGASLGAALTAGYVAGNSTFSESARRSIWNLQGNTLSLEAGPHYISFLAHTNGADSFRFEFGNDSYNRWMPFKVNNDGSVETGVGNFSASNAVSAPSLWQADTTYLVVAKFDPAGGDKSLLSFYDLSDPAAAYLTEPATDGDWLLNAGFSSGVSLDRLTITASQGGVSFDEIRIGSSYADVLPMPAASSLSYTVEQPMTMQPRSWTHTVGDSGDYQIGMAWVEVDSGDTVAIEVFKNGSERVKALSAPAGEVTRLESRIEGLDAGDTITVKITPNGGRYRAGYQIACSTPIFDGLLTFDVHDVAYGAVGDGVTDDFAAIQAAVNAAKAAGGGIVQFDGSKTYRSIGLNDLTVETFIDLDGVANIKIEGNGATVMLHPPDRFAYVRDAENIQIDGFIINYDPIPYYQGTITDIDLGNLTIDIDVPARYPEPDVGVVTNPGGGDGTGRGPFFGRSFIPDAPGARSGRGENIYVESTALIGGDPRKIRIQVPSDANGAGMLPRMQDAFYNNATEFVVPELNYGQRNGATQIYGSSRVKFSNLQYYNMAHFWLTITQNHGPITLSNVDLEVSDPATELLASWRDGMHIKNGRWGILIEEGDWDGAAMYDDTFAIYSRRQVVVSSAANVVTLTPGFGGPETWLWKPGDWASFWSPDQDVLRGMARVISVVDVDSSNYAVTFESLPDGVLPSDIVLHEESLNRGTLVRNCRTTSVGTESATTRLRGTDMRFENNTFEDFDFHLEWSDRLATPRARDVVVQDCTLSSVNGHLTLSRPLGVLFKDCQIEGLAAQVYSGADDVYFDNVAWTNMTSDLLDIRGSSHAWLFGGSTRNGSSSGLSSHVSVDGSSSVTYAAPANYPPTTPPLSTGFAPPTAPLLSAVAGEGRVSLDWSDSAGAASYTVYRSQSIDGPFLQWVQPQLSSYVDSRSIPGQTYFYVVTATDASGNESIFGNLVSAQPTGTHVAPQADAHVIGGVSANGNYGSSAELLCKTDGNADFTRESYLRFDLSGLSGTVDSAKLRLKVAATTGSGDTHTAYAVADDSWTESGIKWNNKPAAGSAIAAAMAPEVGAWIELDVSAQVTAELAGDQSFSTVLVAAGSQLVRYHSKEAASAEDHPELLITMATAPVPAAPTGVVAVVNGSEVELDWADSGAGVDFYGVYHSATAGGPYTHLLDTPETSYLQAPAAEDVTYYYVVTALDSDGNESAYSAEVSATRTSPISIQSLNPTDGLADLPPNLDLILTFSKAITRGSGTIRLVNLSDGGSTFIPVTDTTQVMIDGATVTINPAVNLLENRDYAVRIDAGAVEDVFGNAYGGIADDTTWNFSTTTMDVSRVRNGDFADNATGFTEYPGRIGGNNPASVAEWAFSRISDGGMGINGDGLSTPFGPSNQSAATYYAWLQNGGTQFSQDLSGRLQAQRSYRISYLAASRAGNNSALGRVTVGDDTGTFYDSGQQQWSSAAFVSVSADFTTSASFDGPVVITLSNESASGDLSVDYSAVSIVQIPDYEVWEALYPAADLSDPTADYDGDGLSNEAERAWGLDPTSAASHQVVTAALDPGTDRFSYTRRDPAYHDLIYTIWTSTDLQSWTQDTAALQSAGATVNGTQEVTITVSTPPMDGRLFVQVRVE